MPLSLPSLSVDVAGPRPRASSTHDPELQPGELSELTGLERPTAVPWRIERCVPLAGERWAVGRRDGTRTTWRLVAAADLARLPHPAWLWVSASWLDVAIAQEREAGPTPPTHPLRSTLRRADGAAPSRHHLYKAIAGMLATLRRREPVAVIVSPHALRSAEQPVQALALALLTILPPAWRDALRVSVGDPSPAPGAWDLVFTEHAPEGYVPVDPADAPDEGDDLVAFYVRNRLMADDPEAVEAAAWLPAGGRDDRDPWGTAVAGLLRDGADGVTRLDVRWLAHEPERAVRAVAARLRAGAPLDDILHDLVEVTVATRDERPWKALRKRPAVQRARAVQALLASASRFRPTAALVTRLLGLYPRGATLDVWVRSLLGWLHEGVAPAAITTAVQTTLMEWPLSATQATCSSVWSEVVYGLVALGEDDAAMDALVSPLARRLAAEGAGRALVANWSIVPAAFRDHDRLRRLVRLLAEAPDGDGAVIDLLHHVADRPDEAEAILVAWVDAQDALSPDDPLFRRIRDTDLLEVWLSALLTGADPFVAGERIQALTTGPSDPLWVRAEAAYHRAANLPPRERFLALGAFTDGLPALEPVARGRLREALPTAKAPDPELVTLAERLATVPDASPVWSWCLATLSPPGRLDDARVDDATVRALGDARADDLCATVAARTLRAVGASEAWEPLELARWLVRVRLTPDADPLVTRPAARALMQGIAGRHDALPVLIDLAKALLELPADHPAAHDLLATWLPAASPGGLPSLLVSSLDPLVPEPLRAVWVSTKRRC